MPDTQIAVRRTHGTITERFMQVVFTVAACVCILCVIMICLFLFVNGVPSALEIGPINFIFGKIWNPPADSFGIWPMIVGSIYVTAGAVVVGVPVGVLTAIFQARFAPRAIHRVFSHAINLLAGIPSIIYGFFGIVLLVPLLRELFGSSGKGVLTASLLLGMMILPTVISVSEAAIRAVPESYYEGALALGSTHERAVFFGVVPAAGSGIMAGVVLGIGRAIGETMAVVMVAGNQPIIPESIISGVRTMTANIVLEMGYASGLHREALIATAVVLFIFILIINALLSILRKRSQI